MMPSLFFRNATRRLLYLDAQGLVAYRRQAGGLREDAAFSADAGGIAGFSEYLDRHRGDRFSLVVDVADEGFQIESLPPVRGRDRKTLLSRRLAKHFQDTPFVAVLPLGREASGRRDEKVLLAALMQPQGIAPWLAALRRAACRLDGVYSAALLAEGYVARHLRDFSRNNPHFVLLAQTRAGLRQTFFDNGRMQFSRLVPLSPETAGDPESFARDCVAESLRMRQYLLGQHRLPREATLPVALLIDGAVAACLHRMNGASAAPSCRFVDVAVEEMSAAGIPFRGERLFLSALLRRAPRHQFAPAGERLFQRVWQVRRALHLASLAVSAMGLLLVAGQWNDAVDLDAQTALMRRQAAGNRAQYDRLPALSPIDDGQRALVDSYGDAVRHSFFPLDAYAILGEALDGFEQIRLDRIDWRVEEAADAVTMDVSAALLPVGDDGDSGRDAIGRLAAQLGKTAGVQASVADLPGPAGAARGDGPAPVPAAPKFSVRVRMKPVAAVS